MLAIPALVLGVMGVSNSFAMDPHAFGAQIGIWIILYAILEETGWRGYLQDEFRDQPALLRYFIVALFWYAWHFSYLIGRNSIGSEISNLLFVIAASIGIGFVADRTRSIFAAAAFHMVGNVLMTSVEFRAFIPDKDSRITVVLACVAVWLVMLRLWRMRDKRMEAASREASL
jgi:membrane protease YdiL (CAAX protease family)